jgi:ABC-type nitrate/sulfonate/bicarbonate transport system ATPase subunit
MGASILFVTHSIDEALALGDSVVLLGGGVVAARFPVPQAHPRSLLTDDMIALRRQIVSALETTV